MSLANQTRLPDELIVLDDVSSDDSVKIVETFAQCSPFDVKVLKNTDRLGAAQSFSKALGYCSGDLIFPCDQDDIWLKDKLAIFEKLFETHPECLLAFSNLQMMNHDGSAIPGRSLWQDIGFYESEKQAINSNQAFRHLIKRNVASGNAIAFRSKLISHALPVPQGFMHDEWIVLIASLVGSIQTIEQEVVHYRLHPSQVVSSPNGMMGKWKYARKIMDQTYFDNRIVRAEALMQSVDRLDDLLLDDHFKNLAQTHLKHAQAVTTMHQRWFTRPLLIARELLTGRYHQCDYGLKGVFRDCLL